jgi:hypothetical protein
MPSILRAPRNLYLTIRVMYLPAKLYLVIHHFPCFDNSHLPVVILQLSLPLQKIARTSSTLTLTLHGMTAWYDGAHPSMHDCKLTLYIAVNYLHVYSLLRIQGDNEMEVAG